MLRCVIEEDLPVFFEQQLDREANFMAAFTARASWCYNRCEKKSNASPEKHISRSHCSHLQ